MRPTGFYNTGLVWWGKVSVALDADSLCVSSKTSFDHQLFQVFEFGFHFSQLVFQDIVLGCQKFQFFINYILFRFFLFSVPESSGPVLGFFCVLSFPLDMVQLVLVEVVIEHTSSLIWFVQVGENLSSEAGVGGRRWRPFWIGVITAIGVIGGSWRGGCNDDDDILSILRYHTGSVGVVQVLHSQGVVVFHHLSRCEGRENLVRRAGWW